ncbi:KH domain RNA-binding protein [Mycena sanguinolenta]|uniref:KH domain RNA-binding protein n=1 Tax=Mycena sanguinolenta TaxID=230812 RepID=A0A8H6XFC0_9AGAR|nr:KH domain RNA-binding protein [Mycena sanguinolenta]
MSDSPAPRDSASPPQSRSPSPVANDTLTLRALVSTKDAGVKAGVSKVIQGVHERVLTVTGPVEGVAKAYTLIISQLVATNPSSPTISSPSSVHTSIRLLISHNLMGTIIGRNGLKIKAIQDGSGTRMVASKDMLPQSTERIVEVQGSPEAIGHAIEEIGKCLLEDWERGLGTVLFHPGTGDDRSANRRSVNGLPPSYGTPRRANGRASPPHSPPMPHSPVLAQPAANLRTQNISIPSDMVGCIIGRSGTKITEIRRLSGSKISIAKAPHDETGERMFTIVGTPEANEKALFLLYNQLESEKERRVNKETHQQEMQETPALAASRPADCDTHLSTYNPPDPPPSWLSRPVYSFADLMDADNVAFVC